MLEQTGRVSYIKKPIARFSRLGILLVVSGYGLLSVAIISGVRTQGQIPLSMAAVSLSSLLVGITGFVYSLKSFREKDKNYILARIGAWSGGVFLILWLVMIIIGVGG